MKRCQLKVCLQLRLQPFFLQLGFEPLRNLFRHRLRVELGEERGDSYCFVAHEVVFVVFYRKSVLNQEEAVAALPIADADLLCFPEFVVPADQHDAERHHRISQAPNLVHWRDLCDFEVLPELSRLNA